MCNMWDWAARGRRWRRRPVMACGKREGSWLMALSAVTDRCAAGSAAVGRGGKAMQGVVGARRDAEGWGLVPWDTGAKPGKAGPDLAATGVAAAMVGAEGAWAGAGRHPAAKEAAGRWPHAGLGWAWMLALG
jgi:hypothetical protein